MVPAEEKLNIIFDRPKLFVVGTFQFCGENCVSFGQKPRGMKMR